MTDNVELELHAMETAHYTRSLFDVFEVFKSFMNSYGPEDWGAIPHVRACITLLAMDELIGRIKDNFLSMADPELMREEMKTYFPGGVVILLPDCFWTGDHSGPDCTNHNVQF